MPAEAPILPADRRNVAVLIVGFACLFAWLRPHGLIVADEGWCLHPVLRMLGGEFLYRDFAHHYAPLPFHLIANVFLVTGPSILVARTVWILLLLGSVVGMYRVARRLSSPAIAMLPALAYGLTPGPWHKSAYGFCTVLFLVALARALEKTSKLRVFALGATAGIGMMTRQELGIAQAAIVVILLCAAPPIEPESGRQGLRHRTVKVLVAAFGFVAILAPVFAYYEANGALTSLFQEVFLQAASLSNRPPDGLKQLLDPRTFASAYEGRGIGLMLLVPLAFAPFLVLRFVVVARSGRSTAVSTMLAAAMLALCVPALVQAYNPPLLVRYLQSGIVFYLLVAWFIGSLEGRTRRIAAMAVAAGVVFQVVAVVVGIGVVHPSDAYTGSARVLRYQTPVEVLGDTVYTDEQSASEIAAVRDFIWSHTSHGEPIFTAPLHSLYYVLLDRPNPTAYLGDIGNIAMTVARKEVEMERLLASDVRYALLDRKWWEGGPGAANPVVTTLSRSFHPVRTIGSLVILERNSDRVALRR